MELRDETLKKQKELADGYDRIGDSAYEVIDFNMAKKCYREAFRIRLALRRETGAPEIKHDLATSCGNLSTLAMEEGNLKREKKLKQYAWLLLLEEGKEKAMEQNGSVCVLIEEGIAAKELPSYIMQVSDAAQKPTILVIDVYENPDDNQWINGLAIDKHNIGMEKILRETAHITGLKAVGEFYLFDLRKADAEKIQKEVLARASELYGMRLQEKPRFQRIVVAC